MPDWVTARRIRQLTGPAILAGLLGWSGVLSASAITGISATNPAVLPFVVDAMGLGVAMLGPWHEYATQGLMPDFAEDAEFKPDVAVDESAYRDFGLMPDFAQGWMVGGSLPIQFRYSRETVGVSPFLSPSNRGLNLFARPGIDLERSYFSSGIAKSFARDSMWEVSAVFAQQQFVTHSLGGLHMNPSAVRDPESMSGAGIQFGLHSQVVPGVLARASYQSEIDMGGASGYRGVFSEEGDFDVPASASFGVDLQAARSAWFTFDVSRIMYSDTQAYTNSLMPSGFTSLLGDGGSPNFAWQDQTVYQIGMKFKSNGGIIWNVGYATNQRPEPASESLARALAPEFAADHLIFGLSAPTGDSSSFHFRGALAPSYLFGSSTQNLSDDPGDQLEIQAVWSKDF